MSIPPIDTLSAVLYVPKIQSTQTRTNNSALSERTPFNTVISPSRSRELVQQATNKGQYIQSILQGLSDLAKITEKTTLPTNYPDTSRVNLQAQLSIYLKKIDDIANSAEVGSVSLLRGDSRNIYLQTNELGGSIKVQGLAIDTKSLGLSNISFLSDYDIKNASRRINDALYAVNERLQNLAELDLAINQGGNFGDLYSSAGNGST